MPLYVSCPRGCNVDRAEGLRGFCNAGSGFEIAAVCRHRGEEPVLSGRHGICNIFFSHCNLQCVYCQNHQISRNDSPARNLSLDEVVAAVVAALDEGATHVGFVSPSHMIEQMKRIIAALRAAGRDPVFVMNTNGYDRPGTLAALEGLVDVYLPDFKYMDAALARELSGAADYPAVALAALREMHRQKGSNLSMRNDGTAGGGLIIRHLVLPGHVENSISVLRAIGEELSTSVHISLMSQYYPPPAMAGHPPLDRIVSEEEYAAVRDEMERLGFHRGWLQEWGSAITYQPDFTRPHPFE
jgi:putative pyruvate formate lyase activating enzyme